MTKKRRSIVVVGAGVIGLTTAIRLSEIGHNVTVITQHTPATVLGGEIDDAETALYTSSGSGGLWMPFLLGGEEVKNWATVTYEEFAKAPPDVGVSMREGFVLSANNESVLPWYTDLTSGTIRHRSNDARIPPEYKGAFHFHAPVVQMERYLPHLQERLEQLNVQILLTASLNETADEKTMWTLAQVRKFARGKYGDDVLLVNCTGMGASHLSNDTMIPGRGVTVLVRKPSDKDYFISENILDGHLSHDGLLAYAIPRGEAYTLGGTFFKGDWSLSSTTEERDGVIERALSILQKERDHVEVISSWTGLRPITSDGNARVGIQHGAGGDVIANYGHGGSGVTTCWGCADKVVLIVDSMASNSEE